MPRAELLLKDPKNYVAERAREQRVADGPPRRRRVPSDAGREPAGAW